MAGRRRYPERMRERAVATLSGADGAELARIRRGWSLGGESFRERVLSLLGAVALRKKSSSGALEEGRGHGEEEALGLIEAGLAHFELSHTDLEELPKGDARKLAIAQVVRERTVVSNRWLAGMLHLGHESRVSRTRSSENFLGRLARSLP